MYRYQDQNKEKIQKLEKNFKKSVLEFNALTVVCDCTVYIHSRN
jgi:hypothetical protein